MKKFFVLAVDASATTEQRNAFTNYLDKIEHVGFWHHVSHGWLILDYSGLLTSQILRNQASTIMVGPPSPNVVVIESTPKDWAVWAPQSGHAWMHQNVSSEHWKA